MQPAPAVERGQAATHPPALSGSFLCVQALSRQNPAPDSSSLRNRLNRFTPPSCSPPCPPSSPETVGLGSISHGRFSWSGQWTSLQPTTRKISGDRGLRGPQASPPRFPQQFQNVPLSILQRSLRFPKTSIDSRRKSVSENLSGAFRSMSENSPWGRVSECGLCVYVCVAECVFVQVCVWGALITQNETKYVPIKHSCSSSQQPKQTQCHPHTAGDAGVVSLLVRQVPPLPGP